MRNKSLYLLVACVCGSIAAILASQWLKAQAHQGGSTAEIFVAKVAIDIGEEITPERIRLEQWPVDRILPGATGNFELLEETYAKQRFYAGEPIMPVKLMDENWTTVPKGYRVVAMPASDVNIANLIQPGDRVDVVAFFKKSELIPRSMTKTVLMGIRVYALDGDMERRAGEDRPKTLRNIQLLIHEKDMDAWTYARELGTVRLSLGSDADYRNDDGSNEAGQEFLTWLEDYRERQEEAPEKPRVKKVDKSNDGGFSMIKMVGDRMLEYWIVPGRLPVLVGEVGGEGPGSGRGSGGGGGGLGGGGGDAGTDEDDDYSYLNGEGSPLFQSPTED
jgi:pilus assembly protein CpaB